MVSRRLVLDANILVRAVLGRRVKEIIADHAVEAELFAPEVAYDDAERYLPEILAKHDRAEEIEASLAYLGRLRETVLACRRRSTSITRPRRWRGSSSVTLTTGPILATALALECPIWTEDNDFFGTGAPTWTTDRIELYLKPSQ